MPLKISKKKQKKQSVALGSHVEFANVISTFFYDWSIFNFYQNKFFDDLIDFCQIAFGKVEKFVIKIIETKHKCCSEVQECFYKQEKNCKIDPNWSITDFLE